MGAGNVCTFGECEGLYFVDNEFLDVYCKEAKDGNIEYCSLSETDDRCEYCETESFFNRMDFEHNFKEAMKKRFRSFKDADEWVSRTRRAILENELFYIVCEDNQWSLAVELIQKEDSEETVGLQMGLYKTYLSGIKEILLNMNGEVGIYTSAWTSGVIKEEEIK